MFDLNSSVWVRRRRRAGGRALAVLAASAVVAVTGLATVASTSGSAAANGSTCPTATDLSTLAPGAVLHGLTVSKGTTPENFDGTLIGIQKDGIVPGVDLVIVDLTSSALTAAGGVWQGMSGSPVYAADGTLVGAVSYAMSWGASGIVGVTPAAEMQAMLAAGRASSVPAHVSLSPRLQRAVVGTGAAKASAAQEGMRPMALPLAVSGLSSHRIDQLAHKTRMNGMRPYSAPSVPSTPAPGTPIVTGGNLAASLAYGFFSAVAVGTATEVCGTQVVGFGHPIFDIPRGDLTMHNADVLYVQPDSLGTPYKVANVTGPVGSLPDNLLGGIHGYLGAAPPAATASSTSTVGTNAPLSGTTYASLRGYAPMFIAENAIAVEDRALGVHMNSWYGAPGTDLVTWKVEGTRADGSPFAYTRTDRFASDTDIAYTWPWELNNQLDKLVNNQTETVQITKVTTTSSTDPTYKHLRITGLEVRAAGAWQPVTRHQTVELKAGASKRFRITMQSAALGTRHQKVQLEVPAEAAGQSGYVAFVGGNGLFTEVSRGASVDRMLQRFADAPRNDAILGTLQFEGGTPVLTQVLRHATIGGQAFVQVRAVR